MFTKAKQIFVLKSTTKILGINAFCHIMLIPAFMYGEAWMFVASFVWYMFLAAAVMSGGHHRYYSHRAFSADKWYEYMVNILNVFTSAGPIMTRCATHRLHHASSDTEHDPSSPTHKGFWRIYLNAWGYDTKLDKKYFVGLISDPILKFFHKHHFKMVFATIAVLIIIDPLLFVFAFCIPSVLAFHAFGAANSVLHRKGEPENVWWISILTAGEGDHLHHHNYPRDPRISKYFDLSYLWIQLIRTDK